MLWRQTLDILFPPRCSSCGEFHDTAHSFCAECFGQIRFISEPHCARCGMPFEFELEPGAQCALCLTNPPPYDRARSVMVYDQFSRHLITRFKYSDETQELPVYRQLLLRAGANVLGEAEVIIPVPLHWRRLLKRRYNQSGLLAAAIGNAAQKPVLADGLLRMHYRPPQASLSRKERLKNVDGVFRINHRHAMRLRGAKILLVDDVMTTGATVNACAAILRAGGAERVDILTLARTVRA